MSDSTNEMVANVEGVAGQRTRVKDTIDQSLSHCVRVPSTPIMDVRDANNMSKTVSIQDGAQ